MVGRERDRSSHSVVAKARRRLSDRHPVSVTSVALLSSGERISICQIDKVLQTAQMLRLSEGGFARDNHGNLMQNRDAAAEKLDAYAAGVLAALSKDTELDRDAFSLLVYALAICDLGPGLAALAKTRRMLGCNADLILRRYFLLGARTVRSMLEGSATTPGEFARLLEAE
jgi:hypothetical protein